MADRIHGWIGGRYGSPTEYGLPLDDSYLYENEEEEDWTPEELSLFASCPPEPAEENPFTWELLEELERLNQEAPGSDWRHAA